LPAAGEGLSLAVTDDGVVESAEREPRSSVASKTTSKTATRLPAPASEQINTTCEFDALRSARPAGAEGRAKGPAGEELRAKGPANGPAPGCPAPSGVWPFAPGNDLAVAAGENLAAAGAPPMANGCWQRGQCTFVPGASALVF
jgi:hypothetical protein